MSKRSHTFPFLFLSYGIVSLALFFYSFTQVDLNLTLSRVSIWQTIQKSFQYVGYYQRPLSTGCYIGILIGFFSLYVLSIRAVKNKQLTGSQVWRIVWLLLFVIVLSYPAFSYDMFNYMFTAKTVVLYHQNPYSVIPLQFTGVEPWITFMRWTHLPSAYTPVWIALTLPAYVLGFGYFLLTLWNLKILSGIFFVLSAFFIEKILIKVDPQYKDIGVVLFALNPLVIIETLVSGHNDIVMMTLALASYYIYLQKNYISSFLVLSLSVASKLVTIFLIPLYLFRWNRLIALICMLIGLCLVLLQRDILPWYFVWIIPFVALMPRSTDIILLSIAASFGLLLRYTPFLLQGNWDGAAPKIETAVTLVPLILYLVYIGIKHMQKRYIY